MPAEGHRGVAEWSNAAVLKTVVPQGTGGSNPSSSASKRLKTSELQPKSCQLASFIGEKITKY